MEFFLLVLKHVCAELGLPLAIGSKTVGEAVGKHESAEKVGRVMGNWKKVWQGDEVRQKEELLLPVAVDDRDSPQDWFFVSVRSSVAHSLDSPSFLHGLSWSWADRFCKPPLSCLLPPDPKHRSHTQSRESM